MCHPSQTPLFNPISVFILLIFHDDFVKQVSGAVIIGGFRVPSQVVVSECCSDVNSGCVVNCFEHPVMCVDSLICVRLG